MQVLYTEIYITLLKETEDIDKWQGYTMCMHWNIQYFKDLSSPQTDVVSNQSQSTPSRLFCGK